MYKTRHHFFQTVRESVQKVDRFDLPNACLLKKSELLGEAGAFRSDCAGGFYVHGFSVVYEPGCLLWSFKSTGEAEYDFITNMHRIEPQNQGCLNHICN